MYLKAFIPACESFGWSGGPEFKTRLRVLTNGRERRNADWAQERNRYTIPFQNIGREEYTSIRQMFQTCQGMLHAFLYRDPLDYEADNEVFAVADGSSTYQLTKASIIDGVVYQRRIYALYSPGENGLSIPETPTVTVNGTPTAVTVDYERGTVSFGAPPTPGAILRWSGFFAVWVRFDADWLPMSLDNRRGMDYAHNGTITLMELPAPVEVET